MMTGERLNIPHELLFMAMHQKNRKGCLGLFAFAIAIKMYTGSSTLTNATPQKIRKVFKCGLAKATNLLEHAKRSSMFTLTKEGHIVSVICMDQEEHMLYEKTKLLLIERLKLLGEDANLADSFIAFVPTKELNE